MQGCKRAVCVSVLTNLRSHSSLALQGVGETHTSENRKRISLGTIASELEGGMWGHVENLSLIPSEQGFKRQFLKGV